MRLYIGYSSDIVIVIEINEDCSYRMRIEWYNIYI